MNPQENSSQNPQPKKERTLFIVFALGFLAVLASGNAVLSTMQLDEAAMSASAVAALDLAQSSQGISDQLPSDPNEVVGSVGVFDANAIVGTETKTVTKPATIPR